jgi:hypothetical protein
MVNSTDTSMITMIVMGTLMNIAGPDTCTTTITSTIIIGTIIIMIAIIITSNNGLSTLRRR